MSLGPKNNTSIAAIPGRIVVFAVMALVATSCGKLDDTVNTARDNIFASFKDGDIYERNNLPEDDRPNPDEIKGWFDIIGGAYRWIVNEDLNNPGTGRGPQIARGDSIMFYFDARTFTRGSFESQQTFYTNIASRITELTGNNSGFHGWSTEPLRIKVGDDPRILRSLQEALISCRAGDGDPDNDDDEGGISSDRVRVYLTPDIAFGDKVVYDVPAGSTIVFEVTEIVIL